MTFSFKQLEPERLNLQAQLDAQKTSADRNKLGQFSTPSDLARDILVHGISLLPANKKIRFLDPAIGTGAFYSALSATCPNIRVQHAAGFEVDPHYGLPSSQLWQETSLDYMLADFTKQKPEPRYNLVICNPPYVRHHHLSQDDKQRLQKETQRVAGIKLSGLAGLYCHFLGLSHAWMDDDAIAGWLIPSEFMDVNYGSAIKSYLLDKVTLLQIHRFDPDDVQFVDALVSSAIVWFKNTPPKKSNISDQHIRFTFGGSLAKPCITRSISADVLRREAKWTRFPREAERETNTLPTIGDLFKITRGIATGCNKFFILSDADACKRGLPESELRPILPSPRYVSEQEINADESGNPILDRRLFLLDTRLNEDEIKRRHPALWAYLEEGRAQGIHEGYICRNRPLWYVQDKRPPAPIVCTYLGRSSNTTRRPFRFIRNHSRATIANVYLAMYPTSMLHRMLASDDSLMDRLWRILNEIDTADLIGEGRVYGGGLHKLEPKELANVPLANCPTIINAKTLKQSAVPNLFQTVDVAAF